MLKKPGVIRREEVGPARCSGHQNGRGNDRGPEAPDALGRLRAVHRSDDLAADLPLLLALIPRRARFVIESERRGEHRGRQILGDN